MTPPGVVDALHRVHRALRPDGILLDIHPEPDHPRIEVHRAGKIAVLGSLDTSIGVAKILAARTLLATVVVAGYFAPARTTRFEFVLRFDTVDSWLAYMADRWSEAVIDPHVRARARRLLRRTTGELVLREQIRATRLERKSLTADASKPG